MNDNPMPPIPEKARPALAWVSWLLFLGLGPAAGLVASMDGCKLKSGLIVALGVLGSIAAALKTGLARPVPKDPRPPGSPPAVAVLAVLVLGCASCSTSQGYRAVLITRIAAAATGATITEACRIKRARCRAQYHLATSSGQACTKACRAATLQWTRHVRPALNTALASTQAALEAHRDGGERPDWRAMLKPAVCALLTVSRQWWPIAGPRLAIVLAPLKALDGLACE
jgi:hypothetical protein